MHGSRGGVRCRSSGQFRKHRVVDADQPFTDKTVALCARSVPGGVGDVCVESYYFSEPNEIRTIGSYRLFAYVACLVLQTVLLLRESCLDFRLRRNMKSTA